VEKKMIMVDQRWLWLVETRDVKSDAPDKIKTSIFTSFPRKEREAGAAEKDLEDIADLRQATMDEANSMGIEWATNKCSYVGPVIGEAPWPLFIYPLLTPSTSIDRRANSVLPKLPEENEVRYKPRQWISNQA
jgi:hypothetical protein